MEIVLIVLGAVIGWIIAHLMPGVWVRVTRAPSLHVHVEVDPAYFYAGAPDWVGSAWVLPATMTPEDLGTPPPGMCHEWREWMWGLGAYNAHYTEIAVTLQGNADSTVLVDGLRTMVIERAEPEGHLYVCPVGGADTTPRSVNVDLDVGVVNYYDNDDNYDPMGGGKPFTFTLARGEVERFHVRASSTARCTWTAELLLIVDGKRQTVYVNDDGEPLRMSGAEGLPVWMWHSPDDRWIAREPSDWTHPLAENGG